MSPRNLRINLLGPGPMIDIAESPPRRKRNNRHAQLVNEISKYLHLRKIYHRIIDSNGKPLRHRPGTFAQSSNRGISDILAVLPPNGRLLAIEVKVPPDDLRPAQHEFLAAIREAGGIATVAMTVEQVHDALQDIGHPLGRN